MVFTRENVCADPCQVYAKAYASQHLRFGGPDPTILPRGILHTQRRTQHMLE